MQVTELTFKQIQDIIFESKQVKSLLKECKEVGINDYAYIIADLLPHLVVEDKILKSGKRKGLRAITFANTKILESERNLLVKVLSGMDSVKEFYSVKSFIKNEKNQTMFTLVLTDKEDRFEYQCHWYTVWVELKELRNKLSTPLQKELANEDDQVNQWYERNKSKYTPMSSTQYNEWFFTNKSLA